MKLNNKISLEIIKLKKEVKGSLKDKKEIIQNLKKLLLNSVDKRVDSKVGIAFSGGVDSSLLALICSILKKDFTLYTVGLKNSKDLEAAIKVSKKMGWPLKYKLVSLEEAEEIIKKVVKILNTDDIIKVGVGSTEYAALELVKKDKIKKILTGLGSEEIFVGYERLIGYEKKDYKNANKKSWESLKDIWKRDLERDILILNYFNINGECPFLDKELVKYAMKIDSKLKVNEDHKKLILRECALELGMPKEFAFRKKKAAQYGSGFDKAILKLAKKNGFKYKKEYIKSICG